MISHYGPLIGLFILIGLFLCWIGWDASHAFDDNPNTDTASQYLKAWIRAKPLHALVFLAILALGLCGLGYLTAHLYFQVV